MKGRNDQGDREALAGAALISKWLPKVVEDGQDLEARRGLLEGAMHAGAALAAAGLGLGHAMAQALGGRYGLPHGAMNALALPAALRFNEPVAGAEIARFGEAMGTDDPVGRVEELARLGGFERLRDFGVPREELDEVAEAAALRGGALANPTSGIPGRDRGVTALRMVIRNLRALSAVPPALADHHIHLPRGAWPPVDPRVAPAGGCSIGTSRRCFHGLLKNP